MHPGHRLDEEPFTHSGEQTGLVERSRLEDQGTAARSGVPAKPPRTAEPVDTLPPGDPRRCRRGIRLARLLVPVRFSDRPALRRRSVPPECVGVGRVIDHGDSRGRHLLAHRPARRIALDHRLTGQRSRDHDRRVETTRGSKTTVQRPEAAFSAPSMRVDRSTASSAARSGSRSDGPRPTLNPEPSGCRTPRRRMAETRERPRCAW